MEDYSNKLNRSVHFITKDHYTIYIDLLVKSKLNSAKENSSSTFSHQPHIRKHKTVRGLPKCYVLCGYNFSCNNMAHIFFP